MTWNNITTQITGHTVTAAEWNDIGENMAFLEEVAYVEQTSDVAVSGTSVGAATQIVSAGAVTYEAVPHLIEFYCPQLTSVGALVNIILRDSTTVVGTLSQKASTTVAGEVNLKHRLTPTAAAHTYNVACWLGSADTISFEAGSGGTAGDATTFFPIFIRVSRIPT